MRRLAALLATLLLTSCASQPPAPITAMVTTGFHTRLPAAGTRAQFPDLWPGHGRSSTYPFKEEAMARESVVTWMTQRGVVFVVPVLPGQDERRQVGAA